MIFTSIYLLKMIPTLMFTESFILKCRIKTKLRNTKETLLIVVARNEYYKLEHSFRVT